MFRRGKLVAISGRTINSYLDDDISTNNHAMSQRTELPVFFPPVRQPLAKLTERTSLHGNINNAILHEQVRKTHGQISNDYHHHSNFNTKPDNYGNTGYGGYYNTNLNNAPKSKQTMNKGYELMNQMSWEEKQARKQSSNWLTKSGTKEEEDLAGNLLNNFNRSAMFDKKKIKKSNLLSRL